MNEDKHKIVTKYVFWPVILFLFFLYSCGNNKNSKLSDKNHGSTEVRNDAHPNNPVSNSNRTQNNTNNNGASSSDQDTNPGNWNKTGKSDGVGQFNYYTIYNIIGHGVKNALPSDSISRFIWQSDQHYEHQGIFNSDSRFHLRVKVLDGPSQYSKDSYGKKCKFQPIPYSKLSLSVGLRNKALNQYTDQYTFKEISVDNISKIYVFNVPTGSDLALDIFDVKWESRYNQGVMEDVWHTYCVKIAIQFATDATVDLPGPKINPF